MHEACGPRSDDACETRMRVDRRSVLAGLVTTLAPAPAVGSDRPPLVTAIEAGPGSLRLKAGADTATWAFNGQVPGPLLRTSLGSELRIDFTNKLTQPSSLCWHGVRIDNAMDGVVGLTQPPVTPGATFTYRFTPPDAGLYWYHPHVWPNAAEQIGRGLYGVLIVDERDPPPVDADIIVVLDDWSLDEHGQIEGDFRKAQEARGDGRIGSLLTVNSKTVPNRPAVRPGARLRLRLLNVCSARIVVLSIVGARATVIAVDGQPSETFEPARGTLPIGPGSRFELMLDLPDQAGTAAVVLRNEGGADQPLVQVTSSGPAVPARGPVRKLAENGLLPTRIPLEKSLKHEITINRNDSGGAPPVSPLAASSGDAPMFWMLGGQASDGFSGNPLFSVKRGSAVTLAFNNRTDLVQQMHLHGHVFRLLHDLDDGWDPYWRESVLVGAGKTKHVAFIADNPGRWAIESLVLDRQATGLAGYFVVS